MCKIKFSTILLLIALAGLTAASTSIQNPVECSEKKAIGPPTQKQELQLQENKPPSKNIPNPQKQYLSVNKLVDIPHQEGGFYYANVTCSNDSVFVTFQGNKEIFMVKYTPELNQISTPANITSNIPKRNMQDSYPDHTLVFYKNNFYAAIHNSWAPGKTGLYIVKYDRNMNFIKYNTVSCLNIELNNDIHESTDSPLIQVYNDLIYVTNNHYITPRVTVEFDNKNDRDGLAVSVYDLELNLKEKFVLSWENELPPIGTGDLVILDNGYAVIHCNGNGKGQAKLFIYEFDKNRNFINKRELIPVGIMDTFHEASPRTIFDNDRRYISFNSFKGNNKFGIKTPCVGVFDNKFNFIELLVLEKPFDNNFDPICVRSSEYTAKLKNSLYLATAFAQREPSGRPKEKAEKLVITQYDLGNK